MSRTYRLRHERSLVAHRFVDGRARRYVNSVDDFWSDLIVRGIYGYLEIPKSALLGGAEIRPQFHHLLHILQSRKKVDRIIGGIAGDRRYAVAGMGYHEYAYIRGSVDRAWKRNPRRSRKLLHKKLLAKATELDTFDGD